MKTKPPGMLQGDQNYKVHLARKVTGKMSSSNESEDNTPGQGCLEALNESVRRLKIRELHRDHNLPPRAIARILHVDEAWVAHVLRQIGKEEDSQPMLFSGEDP